MGKQKKWAPALLLGVRAVFLVVVWTGCATQAPHHKELSKTERARMLVEVGNGALVEGDPTGALQNLARAEQEDASLPELHHSKALAYYAKRDLSAAISSAQKAVELKSNYSDANNTLGKLLLDAGRYEEALKPLQVAAGDALYREAYKAWTNLGIIKYRRGEYSGSENLMSRAIQEAPSQACVAYYYRGHLKLMEKHLDEAIQDYNRATQKLCASFGEAHIALGLAYQKNRQYELARKTFLEIQKRYPNTKLAERALDQLKFIP
jgi:Tfp pilus assembly protein PilF